MDLRRIGLSGPITVVPVGIDQDVTVGRQSRTLPTFLYVGRLSPSKRIGHIIRAFGIYQRSVPKSRLRLVGEGSSTYVRGLRKLVRRLGLETSVDFCGWVSAREKNEHMAEAYALLMASVREGWGLAVTEANACGTPAIVYDVPGLRDSVLNGRTGLLVEPSPEKLAEAMLSLTRDRLLYQQLSDEATLRSADYSFEKSRAVFRNAIASTVKSRELENAAS
jgi:glycosyltransferase involved in cell wall biosynthesis